MMMHHRMYLRRCSMSSISEESETGDDEQLDEEFIICNDSPPDTPHGVEDDDDDEEYEVRHQSSSSSCMAMETCLDDLNSFKEEIREAYEELSTLERQARTKTTTPHVVIEPDELDQLLEQLQTLERRLDQQQMNEKLTANYRSMSKTMSPSLTAQFDELDQALATLTNTLNNVEIELADSGNSSSSSGMSDSTTQQNRSDEHVDRQKEVEGDEHFSDSGLSHSTESISLPYKTSSQVRTNSQLSNTSSIVSSETTKPSSIENPIRRALEKMHEANIRKMFVKIHNDDQSTKNILIDETMTICDILIVLLHKYHLQPTYNYTLVEELPDLHLYRIFEDHQNLIHDAIIYWPRDSKNRICFQEHSSHYSMFNQPKEFFSNKEKNLSDILPDYVANDTILLPDDISGILYFKDKTRKIWKKYSCILRQSGIYQLPKSSSSKRELVCLLKFEANMQLYQGINWIEAFRSPNSCGFALKYAHIQKKSNKYIHYICANTFDEYQRWMNGIRVILHGIQLYHNFQRVKKIVEHGGENLEKLLPNQHHFNFIQSNLTPNVSQTNSTISLPISHIVSNASTSSSSKIFNDQSTSSMIEQNFRSLERPKSSKSHFTRSSSFHSSLRRSTKDEHKLQRTYSTSPPDFSPKKNNNSNLKRSQSTREILWKSNSKKENHHESTKLSTTASFIPFIHQCIQAERTPSRSKQSPPLLPPKRPPPPIPPKQSPTRVTMTTSVMIDNHIYDSFQDSPPLVHSTRRSHSADLLKNNEDNRTVFNSRGLPMRVTEL